MDSRAQCPGVRARNPWDGQRGHAQQQQDGRDRPVHGAVDQAAHHGCGTPEEEHDADFALVPAGLQGGHDAHVGAAEHHAGSRGHGKDRRHGRL